MLILQDSLLAIAAIIVPTFAGIFAGMFGIGGGVFFVPLANIILNYYYLELDQSMLIANNTSLACIVSLSTITLWQRKNDMRLSRQEILTKIMILAPGSLLGGWLIRLIENQTLKLIFGLSLIILAIYYYFSEGENTADNKIFLKKLFPLILFPISFLSSLLGIGGAIFLFPLLLKAGYSKSKSAATCSVSTLIIATAATSWLFIDPIPEINNIFFVGDIFWPMIITSILLTPFTIKIGININKKYDEKTLLKILSLLLLTISALHFIA